MPKDPRVELLRSVPLFMDCTDDQVRFIATQVEDVAVKPDEVLRADGTRGVARQLLFAVTKRMREIGTPPAD